MFKSISIQKSAVLLFVMVLIPMSLVTVISSARQFASQRNDVIHEQQSLLNITTAPIYSDLSNVQNTMETIADNNIAARSLGNPNSYYANISINSYVIRTIFDTLFITNRTLSMTMVYCPQTNILLSKDDGFIGWEDVDMTQVIYKVKASFMDNVQNGFFQQEGWYVQNIMGRNFLTYVTFSDGIYCTCLFDLQGMLEEIASNGFQPVHMAFTEGDQILAQWPVSVEGNPSPRKNFNTSVTLHKNLLSDIVLDCQIDMGSALSGVDSLAIFLVALAIILFIMLSFMVFVWHRQVLRPLQNLVSVMDQVSTGDVHVRAQIEGGQELQLVTRTFNQMLEKINTLKIEQYEQELTIRKTKLRYYQAQIQPHFYLNCLKNLYALSKQNDTVHIEKSIMLLSNHLRYCFQWQPQTVSLRREIEMCQNYISLMSISAVLKPSLLVDVPESLGQKEVPAVSLLTFVENSLKYGLSDQHETIIRISVSLLESETTSYLQIGIYDNGPGFSQQQLKELNDLIENPESGQGHIGIRNVLTRFHLIYGDTFTAAFSNQNGGAVELFIEQQQQGGETDS